MSEKIRMRLDPDERLSPEIQPFVRMFLCGCHGVLLVKSRHRSGYVSFRLLAEDDEYWFPFSDNGGSDAFWIPHMLAALQAAKDWCDCKCDKDPHGGWKFKAGTSNMRLIKHKNGNTCAETAVNMESDHETSKNTN